MDPKHIRLLDCTLRDGGHINEGEFGELVIKSIIEQLVNAGIDIIEVGFLWDKVYGTGIARYHDIADVKKILPKEQGRSVFSLMADSIDLEHLEPYDGTIEIIRLSFKRTRWEWGIETAKVLMDKGYKVFINPVNCNVYSDTEYLKCLEKVNDLHPYGFSIVDTFGVMRISDLAHRYYLVENNLNKDIMIGLHLHENLGLAYSLAQRFIDIVSPTRDVVIDASLLGMGRVPGNLCIEQIMEHLNKLYGMEYATEPVYDAIDDYIAPIKKSTAQPWGYATPYALSAKYDLHRTYAEYLMGKQRLKTKDIQRILQQIDRDEAEFFNEGYVEALYLKYMDVSYDDRVDIRRLYGDFSVYDRFIIIAPGKTITKAENKIKCLQDGRTCFISINFCPHFIDENDSFVFLTNMKRYDSIRLMKGKRKLIISSNLSRDIVNRDFVVDYNSLVYFKEERCEDSTLMLLNLFLKLGVKKVSIAGFDGFQNGGFDFFDQYFDRNEHRVSKGEIIKRILSTALSSIKLDFLTSSEYDRIDRLNMGK